MPFQYPSIKQAGLLLVGAAVGVGLYFSYSHKSKAAPSHRPSTSEKTQTLRQTTLDEALMPILHEYYPNQEKQLLEIYDAIGLTPLLRHRLAISQNKTQTLEILNTVLQQTLLRPRGVERTALDDEGYLKLVQERLQTLYAESGLTEVPTPNPERLKQLLTQFGQEASSHSQITEVIEPDVVLLYGSTYPDSMQRQTFFFKQLRQENIEAYKDKTEPLPVYLMAGDRPLKETMDGSTIMQQLGPGANEQDMMGLIFNQLYKGLPHLKAIATNTPKKEGTSRPTTEDTIVSFINDYKLQDARGKVCILAISSEPFVQYQDLVLKRVLLANGITPDKVEVITKGPGIEAQEKAHPELVKKALIAIQLDNLARVMYEVKAIEALKLTEGQTHRVKP